MFSRSAIILLVFGAWITPMQVAADRLTISSDRDWNLWTLPGNAVEVSRGTLTPSFVRRDIDAVANAVDFGGGIRDVGSDARNAGNLIDGASDTFWSPDFADLVDDWWIEVDLGRVVSTRTVRLWFDTEESRPRVLQHPDLGWGAVLQCVRGIVNIEGTLRYNNEFRFSFNDKHMDRNRFRPQPPALHTH